MSYTQAIRFRSFGFYNSRWRRQFISGRSNPTLTGGPASAVSDSPIDQDQPQAGVPLAAGRHTPWWRKPRGKKVYSMRVSH